MKHRTHPSNKTHTVTQETSMPPFAPTVLFSDWAEVGGFDGDVVGRTEMDIFVGPTDGEIVGTKMDIFVGPTDGEIVGAIVGKELLVGGIVGAIVGESVGGLGFVGKLVGDTVGVIEGVLVDCFKVGGTVGDVVGRTVGIGEAAEVGDLEGTVVGSGVRTFAIMLRVCDS